MPMADDITKFEEQRVQFAASLSTVAQSMRAAAILADSFANLVKNANFTITDDGDKKSRKRKAGALDDGDSKRKRKPKDPNAPKRPASSYIMFQNDIRKELKEKNPNITNSELLTLIAKKWGEMSEDDKAIYHKAVADAKEHYSNEKKAYDARSPEEVAAANAATEAAIAAKKSAPRVRASKGQHVPPSAPVPVAVAAETSPSTESSEDSASDSSDDEGKAGPASNKIVNDKTEKPETTDDASSDEEDEEEEAPPPPKKAKVKTAALPPQPPRSTKKKSNK